MRDDKRNTLRPYFDSWAGQGGDGLMFFSWKLLRFLKLRVIFALKTAKIGCTSAKHASKLDAFAFGLHYLCREQNKEEL